MPDALAESIGAPSVELCIVAYRSASTIAAAVRSARVIRSRVSIAVHDNCPCDDSVARAAEAAREIGVPFRAESCGVNCGFGAACNSLAGGSRADVLLFLNPDAELESWPYGLEPPRSSIESPLVCDVVGRPTRAWATAERTVADEVRTRWLRRPGPRPDGVGTVSGAAMLVGREMFVRLGGFDPRFFMYYEDIDLCGRAVRDGYQVRVRTDWRARHLGGRSVGRDYEEAHLRSYRSARAYHAKWAHNLTAFDLVCLADALARSAARPFTKRVKGGHRKVIEAAWSNLRSARSDDASR